MTDTATLPTTTIDAETLKRVTEFHRHMCPGLAMGIRAAEIALQEIGQQSVDEEVVAIVETDMCGVDAIQFLTGCTFGKGNLIHKDHGKNVYTFIRRSDGRAVRVSTRPQGWGTPDPEWEGLFSKVRAGAASPDERQRFSQLHLAKAQRILSTPLADLYDVREVDIPMPHGARIHQSVVCQVCEEPVMETRIHRLGGRELCTPCFEEALRASA